MQLLHEGAGSARQFGSAALIAVHTQKTKSRRAPPTLAAFKHALVSLVSLAALSAAAAVAVRRRASAAAPPPPPPPVKPQRRQPRRGWDGGAAAAQSERNGGLGWLVPEALHRRSLDQEVGLIEARRAREVKHSLDVWDLRWALRTKTLPELRSIAA
jgi:hypothetical protein